MGAMEDDYQRKVAEAAVNEKKSNDYTKGMLGLPGNTTSLDYNSGARYRDSFKQAPVDNTPISRDNAIGRLVDYLIIGAVFIGAKINQDVQKLYHEFKKDQAEQANIAEKNKEIVDLKLRQKQNAVAFAHSVLDKNYTDKFSTDDVIANQNPVKLFLYKAEQSFFDSSKDNSLPINYALPQENRRINSYTVVENAPHKNKTGDQNQYQLTLQPSLDNVQNRDVRVRYYIDYPFNESFAPNADNAFDFGCPTTTLKSIVTIPHDANLSSTFGFYTQPQFETIPYPFRTLIFNTAASNDSLSQGTWSLNTGSGTAYPNDIICSGTFKLSPK